jgi:hypothetical protein
MLRRIIGRLVRSHCFVVSSRYANEVGGGELGTWFSYPRSRRVLACILMFLAGTSLAWRGSCMLSNQTKR